MHHTVGVTKNGRSASSDAELEKALRKNCEDTSRKNLKYCDGIMQFPFHRLSEETPIFSQKSQFAVLEQFFWSDI